MDIIDEDGRIFGVINVIDALVILLVLSVGVAGIALVTSGGEEVSPADTPETETETATTYVTLDLGQQPIYSVSEINQGDAHVATGSTNITITDTWVTSRKNGAQVFARLQVEGPLSDGQLMLQDGPLRLGRSVTLTTPEYSTKGTLIARGNSSMLSVSQTDLTVTADVTASTASQITPEDTLKATDQEVGSVESVSVSGIPSTNRTDDRRVTLRVSVSTAEYGAGRFYGGKVIHPGVTVPIQTNEYRLSGRVESVGGTTS